MRYQLFTMNSVSFSGKRKIKEETKQQRFVTSQRGAQLLHISLLDIMNKFSFDKNEERSRYFPDLPYFFKVYDASIT